MRTVTVRKLSPKPCGVALAVLVLALVLAVGGHTPPAMAGGTLVGIPPGVTVDLNPPKFQAGQPNSLCFDLEDIHPSSAKKTVVISGAGLHRVTAVKVMMRKKSGGPYKAAPGVYASIKSKQPNKLTIQVWADVHAKPYVNQMVHRLRVSWDKGRKILSGSILNIKLEKVCN